MRHPARRRPTRPLAGRRTGIVRIAWLALGAGLIAGCASGAAPTSDPSATPPPAVPSLVVSREPSPAPSVAPSAAASSTPAPSVAVGTEVGDRAPDFALRDLKGKTVSLDALQGRPVWVMFWAPGCVSCEPTLLEADRVQAQSAASDLAVVSIAVYTYPEDAEWYASALDLDYPVALDEDGQVFTRYRAVTLPAHVWIDRDGIIRDWAEGDVPPDVLAAGVAKIVTGTPG